MGKTARWFRGLLGLKKDESPSQSAAATTRSEPKSGKKRWSFVKSYREKERTGNNSGCRKASYGGEPPPASRDGSLDPNKHAIAVAAATAAVADAAVAAAQAAAAVVKLTSSARSNATANTKAYVSGASYGNREEWAAVKIQAHFRAYLSRRALRALKALVKLQALVRGHIVRKQTADMLRRMQVLLRAQARACAGRAQISEPLHSSSKSSQIFHPGPATPEKIEHAIRAKIMKHDQISTTLKRNGSKSVGRSIVDQYKTNDGRNWLDCGMDGGSKDQEIFSMKTSPDDGSFDKILKIDNGKRHFVPKRRNHFQSSHRPLASDQNSQSFTTSKDSTTHQTIPSPSSGEVQSLGPLTFTPDAEESSFCTADDSPQFYSASSRGGSSTRGPFTPTKSDDSRSYLSSYPDHPSYMAYTESSRAKMRSLSAPKQRPQFERSSSALRYSVRGYDDSRWSTQRVSALHANFTSKAYPGSGRLDRLGLPVIGGSFGSNAGHWHS